MAVAVAVAVGVGVVVVVAVGVGVAVVVGVVVGVAVVVGGVEMTRDEVIALAREAGIVVTGEAVWKLCELVTAAERERCAKLVEQYTGAWNDEGFALAAKIRKGE